MGRQKIPINTERVLCLRREGKTVKAISEEFGVSIPTISRRIAELESSEGILTKYRELQGLQLSMHQTRILEAITPEKIKNASITELLLCFYILKKAELAIRGEDSTRISRVLKYL